jgi:radical SAM superfamily enzyme YgiQ (UPF0313 family)
MRIAFVSGNQEKLPDAVVPLGILYVMAATPDHHESTLIDLCFERDPARALSERLRDFSPDLVALGMRNIQGADYSGVSDTLAYYGQLLEAARAATRAPIVMGGPGFSVMPRELMARLRPDFGISGEGEAAFPALCRALETGDGALGEIGSLHWYDGDELRSNASRGFLAMDGIARPDRRLADPRYYERYGIESVQTKRGCPLRCDYCTYPIIEGRVGRARSPAAVVDEMFLALEQHPGIRHFFIVDSVFNLPKAHAKAVCRELIERSWSVPWTCYANPLGFDREMAELSRAAGCAGMEIGSDSGCDEVLLRLKKGFTTAQVRALHEHCAAAGVPDCHTFILGTTGETLDDVRRTLDFAVSLDPWSAIFMLWVDDREALDPVLRAERDVMRSRIAEILRGYTASQPTWAVPPLRINFDARLFSRLRRRGFHGPLWQHIRIPFAASAPGASAPF